MIKFRLPLIYNSPIVLGACDYSFFIVWILFHKFKLSYRQSFIDTIVPIITSVDGFIYPAIISSVDYIIIQGVKCQSMVIGVNSATHIFNIPLIVVVSYCFPDRSSEQIYNIRVFRINSDIEIVRTISTYTLRIEMTK